jgi:hypothetical protein
MKNKFSNLLLLLMILLVSFNAKTQNVGVGTNTPHNSAILDVQSSNRGVSFPSMTTAQRKAVPSPKVGLFVFDLDKNTLYMFDGAQWQAILFSSSDASLPPIERVADDGAIADDFGTSVSISGDYAVVGSPQDDVGANVNQGSAYVFFRNGSTWIQQAKLVASDGDVSDFFGSSVAISGDYIIVGAPRDNNLLVVDQGSAYIFVRNGASWSQQDHVFASGGAASDLFGSSVAISGNYAIVGAPADDVNGNAAQGSAYLFLRSGNSWSQQDQVIHPTGAITDRFGQCVSIDGDYAVVGAPDDDISGNSDCGSVHVFLRDGTNWSHQITLTPFIGNALERFGASVSIYGEWVAVGVPDYGSGATEEVGAAYYFRRTGTTWSLGAFISSSSIDSERQPGDVFGTSISISGDYMVIGAPRVRGGGFSQRGSAYLFRRNNNTWTYLRKIIDPNGSVSHLMGWSVGVSGLNCIMGAPGSTTDNGKVLFLNLE